MCTIDSPPTRTMVERILRDVQQRARSVRRLSQKAMQRGQFSKAVEFANLSHSLTAQADKLSRQLRAL